MRVIKMPTLKEHWQKHGRGDSEQPLKSWFAEAKAARWSSPADIKRRYPTASILADNRVVFNIGGNKSRLVVHVNYELGVVLVKFLGTHAEYDAVDATLVGRSGRK